MRQRLKDCDQASKREGNQIATIDLNAVHLQARSGADGRSPVGPNSFGNRRCAASAIALSRYPLEDPGTFSGLPSSLPCGPKSLQTHYIRYCVGRNLRRSAGDCEAEWQYSQVEGKFMLSTHFVYGGVNVLLHPQKIKPCGWKGDFTLIEDLGCKADPQLYSGALTYPTREHAAYAALQSAIAIIDEDAGD
jgi:hypothetical protein